jgi:hypothetical protein
MPFVLIYTSKDDSDVHRTVTQKNLHAIAGEMFRKAKNNVLTKPQIAGWLENTLKKLEGR